MNAADRIYLDNAATSYPKPPGVYEAVDRYQRTLGTAVGRATTRTGNEVQRTVDRCRSRAAELFGASRPEQVIFTFNGTDSLNLAIHGLLNAGDRVLATVWDHNSVLRPLAEHRRRGGDSALIPSDGNGRLDLKSLEKELRTPTRLVVVTHASNVTGILQPVREITELAHRYGALVLLDAAQTAGHVPVTLEDLGVDMISCPGHKGLLGPLGTGLLILRTGLENQLVPQRQGGTGTSSESDLQPETMPDRFESGNHNAPGLFGLEAALRWIEDLGVESIRQHEMSLTQRLIEGLADLPGTTVHLASPGLPRVGVVSVSLHRLEPQVLCSLLDQHFGIETRAGLHCSPRAHEELGTKESGGAVRFSVSPFTNEQEIDLALEALAQIVASL